MGREPLTILRLFFLIFDLRDISITTTATLHLLLAISKTGYDTLDGSYFYLPCIALPLISECIYLLTQLALMWHHSLVQKLRERRSLESWTQFRWNFGGILD